MGFISIALDIEDEEYDHELNKAIFKDVGDDTTVKELFERIAMFQAFYETSQPTKEEATYGK